MGGLPQEKKKKRKPKLGLNQGINCNYYSKYLAGRTPEFNSQITATSNPEH